MGVCSCSSKRALWLSCEREEEREDEEEECLREVREPPLCTV
jgi:hypothetical protein